MNADLNLQRLSRSAFERADRLEAIALCEELAIVLSERFTKPWDWSQAGYDIVKALRTVGHELYSFDDNSPEFQMWCADWQEPVVGGELYLAFSAPSCVVAAWKGGEFMVEGSFGVENSET